MTIAGVQGKPTTHPSSYDSSFTVRVDFEKWRFEGDWWGDFNAPHTLTKSSSVVKRDEKSKRFQSISGDSVVIQEEHDTPGTYKTYEINTLKKTCKTKTEE